MGVLDRTDEFQQLIKGLVAKGEYTLDNVESLKPQEQSRMNAWSGEIGAEIHQASLKVQELRKMAKKKDIFNVKTSEINELISRVNEDIQVLSKKIKLLEKEITSQGPNHSMKVHTSNVVKTLQIRLHDVTKDFKDALKERTETMAKQQERRHMYSAGQGVAGSNILSQRGCATPSADPDDPENGMQAVSQTQIYHNSRAQAVESVQRTMGELATMMKNLAVMVDAQKEMVERVDSDTDCISDHIDGAQEHLLTYYRHITSNRSLIIKLFMILIFFVVFFIVFLA